MRNLLLLLLLLPATGNAQKPLSAADSAWIYQGEMGTIWYRYVDSIFNNPRFRELQQNVQRLRAASDHYRALNSFVFLSSADLRTFNRGNAASGFPPISGHAWGMGFGGSYKKKNRIFDFNLFAVGVGPEAKKGTETISSHFVGMMQLEWGYDFIPSARMALYAYGGGGLRSTTISYRSPVQNNSSFSNISNIRRPNGSTNESVGHFTLQGGIGFEYNMATATESSGIIVYIKAGTVQALNPGKKYDIDGITYQPRIRYGDIVGIVGCKMFRRDFFGAHSPLRRYRIQ